MAARISVPSAGDFPKTADLVIVGGGIVGAATAFHASRAGLRTVVVERRVGLATLTTTRSLEAFRAQFDDPDDVAMMRESIAFYERFAEEVGLPDWDISLHQQGYLFVTQAEDGPARLAQRVAAQRRWGLEDVEDLSGDEARRRFPFLSADVTGAAFRQRDGWLASHEASYGFARGSRAGFLLETEVVGFEQQAGRLAGVVTSRGSIATPSAVISAGPFSGTVAGLAGIEIPFFALRRHRAGIKAHALIPRDAPMTVSLETGAHWRPEGPGAFLGWSRALEESPSPPLEVVPADETFPALAIDAVSRFAPFWEELAATLVRGNVTLEAGQYDMTPDAKPIIGPVGGVEGLFANTGYSGHGVMGAPSGARRVVDLILGRVRDADNPFSPSRFLTGRAVTAKMPL